jgi:hypothetical protein
VIQGYVQGASFSCEYIPCEVHRGNYGREHHSQEVEKEVYEEKTERRNELSRNEKTFSRSKPWQIVTDCRPHKLAHPNIGYESLDNAARAAYASVRCTTWDNAGLGEARAWLCTRLRQSQVIIRWNGEALNEDFQEYVIQRYARHHKMESSFIPQHRFYECTEHNPPQITQDLLATMGLGGEYCEGEKKMEKEPKGPKEPTYDLAREILKKVGERFRKNQSYPRTMSHAIDGKGAAMMCLSDEKAMTHFTCSAADLEKFAKITQNCEIPDMCNPCNDVVVGYVHYLLRLELKEDMDGSYEAKIKFPLNRNHKRFQGFFAGYMWKKGG